MPGAGPQPWSRLTPRTCYTGDWTNITRCLLCPPGLVCASFALGEGLLGPRGLNGGPVGWCRARRRPAGSDSCRLIAVALGYSAPIGHAGSRGMPGGVVFRCFPMHARTSGFRGLGRRAATPLSSLSIVAAPSVVLLPVSCGFPRV